MFSEWMWRYHFRLDFKLISARWRSREVSSKLERQRAKTSIWKPFSARIQTYIVPWIVVSVLVYTIFYLGALISSFLVIWDRFKVNPDVIKSIRRKDTDRRRKRIESARESIRSRGRSSGRSRNNTSSGENGGRLELQPLNARWKKILKRNITINCHRVYEIFRRLPSLKIYWFIPKPKPWL